MKIHEAVKDITTRFGTVSITHAQFVNLLDDVGGFKESPAASKRVLKDLLKSGFAELAYQIAEHREDSWQNKVRKIVFDYISRSGYKESLVQELAANVLLGLGVINELPHLEQPSSAKTEQPIAIKDPKELLYALKQEYITALSELMTIKQNELGILYGYYTSDALTKLYVLEYKMLIVAHNLGHTDFRSWIDSQKADALSNHRPSKKEIDKKLREILTELQAEYSKLVESSIVIEDDEFGLKQAALSQSPTQEIETLEIKIQKVGQRIGCDGKKWIKTTRQTLLDKHSSSVSERMAIFDGLKNSYLNRLKSLDAIQQMGDISTSDSELSELRRKLIKMGCLLQQDMTQWCDSQVEQINQRRAEKAARKKKRNTIAGIAAGLAVLVSGWQGGSYLSSQEAIETYQTTMSQADIAMSEGRYPDALSLYLQAEHNYDGSFSSSSYKSAAHSKAVEASDQIVSNWEEEISNQNQPYKGLQAKLLTLSLPKNLLLEGTTSNVYQTTVASIDVALKEETEKLINDLLTEIYKNKGTLSSEKRALLEEMLQVSPDNYWLNFIKEKSK